MKKFQKETIKQLITFALMSLWETGKVLGFILLFLISALYLASPMFDYVIDFLFVEHLKESLSTVFTLWIGISVSICISVCIQSLNDKN